ncbi:glycosyltransferase family 4 protein [Serratia sp. JUb9]|uniref:glycosyltransferase family 4 protein n=2 Tax=Serratia TaxID=613 RepID=UPI00164E78DA|nr:MULTISPECIES: glycosyltransferase family 1 protein [Serratia]MCR0999117.1 glycosyltransferase family 4 protein [Serratia rubidaea]QNK34855.1 glycosyltransferase family 4 protein [Serratia sp. JUb9]
MLYVNARFLTQEMTGVQRFAEEISLALKDQISDIVFISPPGILREEVARKLDVKVIGERTGHLWEQIDLPRYLKSKGSPLLLNLCSTAPILYKNKIVTHHDITYKRYPQSFSKKFRLFYNLFTPLMLKGSRHLITVSNFSKGEVCQAYRFPEDKVSVVYNAVSNSFKPGSQREDGAEKYLLAVSSPNYHKNFHGMIEAYAKLASPDVTLKIIGKASGVFLPQSLESQATSNDKVKFLGRVDDSELVDLYNNALAFVFPSFYEGFGIPPLEAQACGCPVISSKTASMPEVLADSVLYFDPESSMEIAEAMKKVINDAELRDNLTHKGFENVRRFSWQASAEVISKLVTQLK